MLNTHSLEPFTVLGLVYDRVDHLLVSTVQRGRRASDVVELQDVEEGFWPFAMEFLAAGADDAVSLARMQVESGTELDEATEVLRLNLYHWLLTHARQVPDAVEFRAREHGTDTRVEARHATLRYPDRVEQISGELVGTPVDEALSEVHDVSSLDSESLVVTLHRTPLEPC
ncbi:hypothetical protein [Streptomyces niveus]|uniref:hypothetical protein n=1 Tax=Streptomyces niveus TaxID=193462 RepID=UPI003412A98C